MAKSLVSLTVIAAAVVVAGCGGGSASKSAVAVGSASNGAGTVSGRTSRQVTAKNGNFRTVVPLGFGYISGQAQYQAAGPGVGGKGSPVVNLVVVREPVVPGGINAVARQALRAVRQLGARVTSGPLPLSVGGQPALQLEYEVNEKAEHAHFRRVFVRHGSLVYDIREGWPPNQESTARSGFEELLSEWQWQ